jgi:hypothetical protein
MSKLEPAMGESQEAYMQRCMNSPEMQSYPEKEREAHCAIMFNLKGTSNQTIDHQRQIGFDKYKLEDKIIYEDDKILTMPAIIASEIVQQYSDGYAYKPADELEKMAYAANRIGSVAVKVLEHPGADTNYLLLKQSDVDGVAKNFQYVKNLLDAKTNRPCRRGVKAEITWFKDKVSSDILDKTKNKQLNDNSIGFTFDIDPTSGEFEGVKYDYVQRNIFLNHVAAPIEAGRCPGPICGIGYDSTKTIQIDAKAINDCPVCSHMRTVGWGEAGQRLYKAYGPDVLEVIDTGVLPKVEVPKSSIDEEFAKVFSELDHKLKSQSPYLTKPSP